MIIKLFEDNAKLDKIVKLGALVGMLAGAIAWTVTKWEQHIDPILVTEQEVIEIDQQSMADHVQQMDATPYAMKNDVNHIANLMVDEQINDARIEIRSIEDAAEIRERELTEIEKIKIKRLEKDIERYGKQYLTEPGELHTHDR